MSEGSISGTREGPATLPGTTLLKLKLKLFWVVTRVKASTVREMLWKLHNQGERLRTCGRERCCDMIRTKLWELHRRPNNRKGSLSATYKKNAESSTKTCDLNQKTMQALDTLAEEYEAFEVTMEKVAFEHEEGDMLYAVGPEVAEELDRAHRLQDEPEFTCEGIVTASEEFTNCWVLHNAACEDVNNTTAKLNEAFRQVSIRRATHEATCAKVKKASQRTSELKRKATEAP